MKRFILLFIFSSGFCSGAKANEECTDLLTKSDYQISPYQGKKVPNPTLLTQSYSKLDFETYELGNSFFQNVIYRVIPFLSPPKSFVIKQYTNQTQQTNDYAAFELIRSLNLVEPYVTLPRYKFVNLSYSKDRTPYAILEDIKGQTLFDILADKSIPESVKKSLLLRFNIYLDQLTLAFHSRYLNQVRMIRVQGDESYYLNNTQHEKVLFQPEILIIDTRNINPGAPTLYIKSDNVIVTPHDELKLIDPI